MEGGEVSVLFGHERPSSLDGYIARGGGTALFLALERSPDAVIDEVARSGLRGRGGAGFPTWKKWHVVRSHACPTRYVVCNAADGEPGTFKDRHLIRTDPYPMLEGLAIAAHVVGAAKAFVATKGAFQREVAILRRAVAEMRGSDMLGRVPVEIVEGPDEYLYGEEKALLEVIEGNDPLPRILPPYQVGLFATHGRENPTVVNNAETWRTCRTSCAKAPIASGRWERGPPLGPCSSPSAETWRARASTSCHSACRSERSCATLGVRQRERSKRSSPVPPTASFPGHGSTRRWTSTR